VQKVERQTGASLGCLPLGAGTNPWALAVDADADAGRAWVTTFLSGEVIEIDLAAFAVTRRVTVGAGLEGIHVDADDIAVTLTGYAGAEGTFGQGYVVVLDRATLAERRRLAVPVNPQALFAAGGRLHVICTGNYGNPPPAEPGRLVRLSPDRTGVSDTLLLGGSPVEGAVAADGRAFLAGVSGGLRVVDTATFTLAEAGLPDEFAAPGWSGVDARGNLVLAVNFDLDAAILFDAAANTMAGSRLTGDGPVAVALVPAAVAPAAPTP
jgi:DNA-binding beta-propeller fold protein YncE